MASRLMAYKFENMPTAKLTFNLPEEDDDFRLAQDGWRYRFVLNEFRNHLRNIHKHGGPVKLGGEPSTTEEQDMAWDLSEYLSELMNGILITTD